MASISSHFLTPPNSPYECRYYLDYLSKLLDGCRVGATPPVEILVAQFDRCGSHFHSGAVKISQRRNWALPITEVGA